MASPPPSSGDVNSGECARRRELSETYQIDVLKSKFLLVIVTGLPLPPPPKKKEKEKKGKKEEFRSDSGRVSSTLEISFQENGISSALQGEQFMV